MTQNLSSLRGGGSPTPTTASLNFAASQRLLLRNSSGSGAGEEGTIEQALAWIANSTSGDLLYNNGVNWARLAKGTANQYLRMNAGGTFPEWISTLPVFLGRHVLNAAHFDYVGSSHPITTLAPTNLSTTDPDLMVVQFDPLTEWGRSFGPLYIPTAAVGIRFTTVWQAVSSPASTKYWVPKIWSAYLTNAAVFSEWNSGYSLTPQMTTDATWRINIQDVTLGNLNYTAGDYRAFVISREVNNISDDLAVNALLAMLILEFY